MSGYEEQGRGFDPGAMGHELAGRRTQAQEDAIKLHGRLWGHVRLLQSAVQQLAHRIKAEQTRPELEASFVRAENELRMVKRLLYGGQDDAGEH